MYKTLHKLLGLVLALSLALGLSPLKAVAATAAANQPTGGKLTVQNLESGDVVELFKVADITVNDDNTTTKAWVNGFNPGGDISTYTGGDDAKKHEIANAAATYAVGKTAVATATSTGASVEFSGLDAGLYFVKVGNPNNASIVYQSTLAPVNLTSGTDGSWSVATDNTISLKKTDITKPADGGDGDGEDRDNNDPANAGFTKTVSNAVDGTFAASVNTVKTGDFAYFRITVSVPKYYGATNRTFKVEDTLPTGVTFVSIENNTAGITATQAGSKVTFDLSSVLDDGKDGFSFIYKVQLNATELDTDGFVNSATITFSQNSYDDSLATTTPKTATINAANIKVTKKGEADALLQGATFELYSGDTKIATGTTGSDGTVTFDTLVGAGSYTLKETKAPATYTLAADTTVTVSAADADANTTVEVTVTDAKDALAGILPETGGTGTILLTILGVVIVALAITQYVRTRKEH